MGHSLVRSGFDLSTKWVRAGSELGSHLAQNWVNFGSGLGYTLVHSGSGLVLRWARSGPELGQIRVRVWPGQVRF